jgi:hypothetical protein
MSNTERFTPGLRPLLVLDATVPGITSVGATPSGEIRLIPITGGTFEGEELRGEILGGGADWQDVRIDKVRSVGVRAATPEVLERLGRGELVPASEYYFRTAMRFRTAAPRLARLNDVLAVAYGERRRQGVHLEVFEVL